MKKIIALSLLAIMSMTSFSYVAAVGNDVEIRFKVGESTLMINNKPTDVETPYVVGEGTTLVPLRVISEAFGADVVWNGEDKAITLTYGNDNILLQIDNKKAVVNGTDMQLAEAPQLTQNGLTMIPLRFISENFGAAVSYDESTSAITVKKAAVIEDKKSTSTLKLSEKDKQAIKAGYIDVRYSFEQNVLPEMLLDKNANVVKNNEDFTALINEAWELASGTWGIRILSQSDTKYVIESDEDALAIKHLIDDCGYSSKENIEKIDYIDNNDNTIAVITMKDCDGLTISKYIGVSFDKNGNYRYFTLEKSFGDYYMFCEIKSNERSNYGTLTNDYNSFIEAIKKII